MGKNTHPSICFFPPKKILVVWKVQRVHPRLPHWIESSKVLNGQWWVRLPWLHHGEPWTLALRKGPRSQKKWQYDIIVLSSFFEGMFGLKFNYVQSKTLLRKAYIWSLLLLLHSLLSHYNHKFEPWIDQHHRMWTCNSCNVFIDDISKSRWNFKGFPCLKLLGKFKDAFWSQFLRHSPKSEKWNGTIDDWCKEIHIRLVDMANILCFTEFQIKNVVQDFWNINGIIKLLTEFLRWPSQLVKRWNGMVAQTYPEVLWKKGSA